MTILKKICIVVISKELIGDFVMEKTIDQWLKENLTEEQYNNAIKHKNEYGNWEDACNCLSDAIDEGFWWDEMPEGFKYWYDKYEELKAKGQ